MSATTPVQEERAAGKRDRNLAKARKAQAAQRAADCRSEHRDLCRKLTAARREVDRLQARYDRVDLASDEALRLQSRLLGILATIRRLEARS